MTHPALEVFLVEAGVNGSGKPAMTARYGRKDLCQLFADLQFRRGAEIGVWAGEFSELLCRTIHGLALTCVDPWRAYDGYQQEQKNDQRRLDVAHTQAIQRLSAFECTIVRETSIQAAKAVPNRSLDFVYIDGNHVEPFITQDLTAWMPKIRSGGILAGHDYHFHPKKPFLKDVKPAVDRFTASHGIEPWYVLMGDKKAASYFWVVT